MASRNNRLPRITLHPARVLPALRTSVAPRSRLEACDPIVAVTVNRSWVIWWRGMSNPPPATWTYIFESFTGDDSGDEWGLGAAVFIAQYRRRHSHGPTFRELFDHLLIDSNGVPSALPLEWDVVERRRGNRQFRHHVAIEWRRRGFIGFDRDVSRSLRVGPRFRELSRARRRARARDTPNLEPTTTPFPEGDEDSLTVEDVLSLLRVAPTSLRRLSRRGYLHTVSVGDELRYPSWQFASQPTSPVVSGIEVIVPAIPPHWATKDIREFMVTPRPELNSDGSPQSPISWLLAGQEPRQVADIIRSLARPKGA